MRFIDWRDAPADLLTPAFEGEQARWAAELDWDATTHWVLIETARAQGTLPGYVALDNAGQLAGWTFYSVHEDTLEIGGLTGQTHAVARQLLNTVMRSPEATRAREVSCFVFPTQSTTSAFIQRRFQTMTFLYLRRDLRRLDPTEHLAPSQAPGRLRLEPWSAAKDGPDTVRLMEAAYRTSSTARCFSGQDGREGWVHYLRQLIQTPACGRLLPTASFTARRPQDGVSGAVLTTSIGPRAAHVAQLIVDPACQGRGVGRQLLDAACVTAAEEGRRYVTLLVHATNGPARALYARAGFEERSTFLYGWRLRPIPRTANRAVA